MQDAVRSAWYEGYQLGFMWGMVFMASLVGLFVCLKCFIDAKAELALLDRQAALAREAPENK